MDSAHLDAIRRRADEWERINSVPMSKTINGHVVFCMYLPDIRALLKRIAELEARLERIADLQIVDGADLNWAQKIARGVW